MSGPIEDIPVHVCRASKCGKIAPYIRTLWLADPAMRDDTDICPRCGSRLRPFEENVDTDAGE
jgi:rRNA maturation endonuclease Nob1